jgi:hypothetical protein
MVHVRATLLTVRFTMIPGTNSSMGDPISSSHV